MNYLDFTPEFDATITTAAKPTQAAMPSRPKCIRRSPMATVLASSPSSSMIRMFSSAAAGPAPSFDVVVDLQPEQDPAPWLDRGASWVLTRIGPYDLDLAEVRRRVSAGPSLT